MPTWRDKAAEIIQAALNQCGADDSLYTVKKALNAARPREWCYPGSWLQRMWQQEARAHLARRFPDFVKPVTPTQRAAVNRLNSKRDGLPGQRRLFVGADDSHAVATVTISTPTT